MYKLFSQNEKKINIRMSWSHSCQRWNTGMAPVSGRPPRLTKLVLCVYCTTRYNKCGKIGTKWLFFFTFIEECCVLIEKNIDKKLANRIKLGSQIIADDRRWSLKPLNRRSRIACSHMIAAYHSDQWQSSPRFTIQRQYNVTPVNQHGRRGRWTFNRC